MKKTFSMIASLTMAATLTLTSLGGSASKEVDASSLEKAKEKTIQAQDIEMLKVPNNTKSVALQRENTITKRHLKHFGILLKKKTLMLNQT